jgi:hypothetical protein
MATSRYLLTPRIKFAFQYGTSETVYKIRQAISSGAIDCQVIFLKEIIRLDVLAGQYYGDGKYYWVIAAASNIGFAPQVPPNTRIVIPNLQQTLRYLG